MTWTPTNGGLAFVPNLSLTPGLYDFGYCGIGDNVGFGSDHTKTRSRVNSHDVFYLQRQESAMPHGPASSFSPLAGMHGFHKEQAGEVQVGNLMSANWTLLLPVMLRVDLSWPDSQ